MLFFVLRAACLPLCQAEEKQEMQRGDSMATEESRVKAEKERGRVGKQRSEENANSTAVRVEFCSLTCPLPNGSKWQSARRAK